MRTRGTPGLALWLILVVSLGACLGACGKTTPLATDVPKPKAGPVLKKGRLTESQAVIPAHDGGVGNVALSPDGKYLATAGVEDGLLKVWDIAAHTIRCEGSQTYPVTTLVYGPDGKQLLTASASVKASGGFANSHGQLLVWDALTCKQSKVIMEDARLVEDAVFAPDGKTVACIESKAHVARIFDAAAGTFLKSFEASDAGSPALGFLDGGKGLLVTSDEGALFYEVASGVKKWAIEDAVSALAIARDGKSFAIASGVALRTFDAAGNPLRVMKSLEPIDGALAFSADGRRIASGGDDGAVVIWNAANGDRLQSVRPHDGPVLTVGFSPDGSWFASGSEDGTVALFGVE